MAGGSPPVAAPEPTPRVAAGTRRDVSAQARDALGTTAADVHDVIATIVHDLKNPLSIIAVEANVVEQRLGTHGPIAIRRSVERIAHNAWYIDRLVSDLLDLGAVDAGALELHLERADLAELLANALDRAVSTLDRHRVELDITAQLAAFIDVVRIERVISNLVGNALKYGPPDAAVRVRLEARGTTARISVIDSGPGIGGDDARVIFERYRRGDAARGRRGYGLGLYISRWIVDAHGGRIGVASTSGQGACFWFEIPTSP